jgi:AcrR family transcriptional regulator
MIIPPGSTTAVPAARCEWTTLDLEGKRERLLSAAGEVFARNGLDAPMSEVAEAAGAGVASVYRLFASKQELLATLVALRLDQIGDAARAACRREGDPWSALTGMLRMLVQRQAADDFLGDARAAVADHPDVVAATERATVVLDRLLAAARRDGRLRSDATTLDLRLLFAAEQWPRMLELLIDALDTRPPGRTPGRTPT